MKRLLTLILLIPILGMAQSRFGHGTLSVSTLLPIISDSSDVLRAEWKVSIADSSRWTAGSTIHAIKPRDGKTAEADSAKFGALRVTGVTILDGTLTMMTTAAESITVAAGGIRNEGGLIQKDTATFGTTGTQATIATSGKITSPDTLVSTKGIRTEGPSLLKGQVKLGTGSNAAPELAGSGDTDTGIRFVGGNKMQFVQGGLNSHTFRPYTYTMTYSDGDTLGIRLDGTYTNFLSTSKFQFAVAGTNMLYITSASVQPNSDVNPYLNDAKSLGSATYSWKSFWGTDNIYLYQFGQTPKFLMGVQKVYTEETDSVYVQTFLNGDPITKSFNGDGIAAINHYNTNGQMTSIKMATVSVTLSAAATVTASNLIPAGSMVVGVTTRVTTAVTGDAGFTGFSVGDGIDADRWGANLTPTLGETSDLTDCTITSAPIYNAATSIVLTQVGGSTFAAGGVVRITVHYISLTAPTG